MPNPPLGDGEVIAYVVWKSASPGADTTQQPLGSWPKNVEEAHWYAVIPREHPETQDLAIVAEIPVSKVVQHGLRPGDELIVKIEYDRKVDGGTKSVRSIRPRDGKIVGFPKKPISGKNRRRYEDERQAPPSKWLPTYMGGTFGTVLDLIAPVFHGSRVCLFAPPKVGKTSALTETAKGVQAYIESLPLEEQRRYRTVFFGFDERPEEVHFPYVDVVFPAPYDQSSTFSWRMIELYMEWAKRQAESGIHVIALVDSVTRVCEFYISRIKSSSGSKSGGLTAEALDATKKFFGMHGCFDPSIGMGSTTIFGTFLIDTGDKGRDNIAEEFKSRGNTDVTMNRNLATQRLYPAVVMYQAAGRFTKELETSTRNQRRLGEQFGFTESEMDARQTILYQWLNPTAEMVAQNQLLVSLARGVSHPRQVWEAIDPADPEGSRAKLHELCVDQNGEWPSESRLDVKKMANEALDVLLRRDPALLRSILVGRLEGLVGSGAMSVPEARALGGEIIRKAEGIQDRKPNPRS